MTLTSKNSRCSPMDFKNLQQTFVKRRHTIRIRCKGYRKLHFSEWVLFEYNDSFECIVQHLFPFSVVSKRFGDVACFQKLIRTLPFTVHQYWNHKAPGTLIKIVCSCCLLHSWRPTLLILRIMYSSDGLKLYSNRSVTTYATLGQSLSLLFLLGQISGLSTFIAKFCLCFLLV